MTAEDGAGNVAACGGPVTYDEQSTAATPAFTGLGALGTADTPRLVGIADAGSTVRIYADAACASTPLAAGPAADFANAGLPVAVPGAAATLYAQATDALGNVSRCSVGLTYSKAPAAVGVSPAVATPLAPAVAPAPAPVPAPVVAVRRGCRSVPKLTGHTLAGAALILTRSGCSTAKLVVKGKARRSPAKVLSQWPLRGHVLRDGKRITVRVR